MADRGRLITQQRAKTVLLYAETKKSLVLTQRRFHQHFNTRRAPVKNIIYRLYRQFENDSAPCSSQSRQRRTVYMPLAFSNNSTRFGMLSTRNGQVFFISCS
ncbi:hypothetical protein C0J52_20192 [Blattella germanica]|nr:hypothetical protein C0J52_20192 [Blattella germanica]PSN40049.1 hypothetical protein C0J52_20192 [Blattella germanica]